MFGFDWRRPLAESSAFFKEFIFEFKKRSVALYNVDPIPNLTIVCHSMGGLVARAHLRQRGPARIERIITIGTPHHGSVFARGVVGRCLAQMRPGNAWLAELNRNESKPPPVPITSIWSRHDSLVAPQASSELACAENVAVVGVGHNALLGDREVGDAVVRAIIEARNAS